MLVVQWELNYSSPVWILPASGPTAWWPHGWHIAEFDVDVWAGKNRHQWLWWRAASLRVHDPSIHQGLNDINWLNHLATHSHMLQVCMSKFISVEWHNCMTLKCLFFVCTVGVGLNSDCYLVSVCVLFTQAYPCISTGIYGKWFQLR